MPGWHCGHSHFPIAVVSRSLRVEGFRAETLNAILYTAEPMHTTTLQLEQSTAAPTRAEGDGSQPQQAQAADLNQSSQQGPLSQQASQAQQAQQGLQQGVQQKGPVGGVLRKPRLVGIGHMCRAVNDLTGGRPLQTAHVKLLCCEWQSQQFACLYPGDCIAAVPQGRNCCSENGWAVSHQHKAVLPFDR